MELVYTNPGLDEQASQKIIAILQDRLSQEQEAALLLKHAHWNMKGPIPALSRPMRLRNA